MNIVLPTDHFIITFDVRLPVNYQPLSTPWVIFDYSKVNYIDFCNFLSTIDFSFHTPKWYTSNIPH